MTVSLYSLLFEADEPTSEPTSVFKVMQMLGNTKNIQGRNQLQTRLQWLVSKGFKPYKTRGASRIVFDIGDGRVLKLNTREDQDANQNINEVDVWEKAEACLGKPYVAPIFGYDKDSYSWIIARKAETGFSVNAINNIVYEPTGIKFKNIDDDFVARVVIAVNIMKRKSYPPGIMDTNKELMHSPWFRGFVMFLATCKVDAIDIITPNWGMIDGKPVLIDYGLKDES